MQLAKQAANVDVAVDAALRNWLYHCRQAGGPSSVGRVGLLQAMRALLMGRSWSFLHLGVVTYLTSALRGGRAEVAPN